MKYWNIQNMNYKIQIEYEKTLTVILIKDVQNTPEIRKMIMKGQLQCCVLKPSFIVDPFQIAVSANKAVLSQSSGKMATKSVYTEILFNMSLSKNISQSLANFGIGDDDKNFVLCVIDYSDEDLKNILTCIQGDVCSIDLLSELSDETLIRKEYKISEEELSVSSLLHSVVSRIAAKDYVIL